MIEKIIYKKKLFALIVRGKYRNKKGITFFTPKESTQQFGYMKHEKTYIIKPHLHKKRLTRILYTTEVILLLKGIVRVDFYTHRKKEMKIRNVWKDTTKFLEMHEDSRGRLSDIFYDENIAECYSKLKIISKEVSNQFKSVRKNLNYKQVHPSDKTGKSTALADSFFLNLGSISIRCTDWSDEMTKKYNWTDNLRVNINTTEFNDWLNSD